MKAKERITRPCIECGKLVTRCPSQMRATVCCSLACSQKFTSKRMTRLNIELNPERMIPETKKKLREARLNTGEGKTYTKTYGRHTHRVVMEEKLGRSLKIGEVVHHIDHNRRNNDPDNLMLFRSQAEHALWHQIEKRHKHIWNGSLGIIKNSQ